MLLGQCLLRRGFLGHRGLLDPDPDRLGRDHGGRTTHRLRRRHAGRAVRLRPSKRRGPVTVTGQR
ncbi:hypothetical protein GCM10018784_31710 [Streptomyces hydrogenans]|nr:hypothetical protein GCM10018784_31710 [Streptomyces hydrogenans]